ncbi:MAG: 2-oxo acid dehydrogenase subunit E2 [Thermoplasmatota archaeon]
MNLQKLVLPSWPPLRHVEAGWNALTQEEQGEIEARVAAVDRRITGRREATLPFFAFLAQVETIAIEIPLRFLERAPEEHKPLLRRQLVDEVFHSVLFVRIAHELALPDSMPPAPSPAAEELLDLIRSEEDWEASVTLLNLAECWIENLFRHAARWEVAPDVFRTVLADEARHVEEAFEAADADAVERMEAGLMALFQEPRVSLAMNELAGTERYVNMVNGLQRTHRNHLKKLGLSPGPAWEMFEQEIELPELELATKLPQTPWRASAAKLWHTPRDPTMQGDFDLLVDKVPKKLLTPFVVATVGRAWAKHPELNRVFAKGRTWQLPRVNVGVRVLVNDQLATVVVTDADKRSLSDISQAILDGVKDLEARHKPDDAPIDDSLYELIDPGVHSFAVAISNPGKFGMVRGAGALSGHISPSTDISVGQRRRIGLKHHVNFGCLQDHRVFDGREAGVAMRAIQAEAAKVKEILRAKNTYVPSELRMIPAIGKYAPTTAGGALIGIGATLGMGAIGFAAYQLSKRQTDAAELDVEETEEEGEKEGS